MRIGRLLGMLGNGEDRCSRVRGRCRPELRLVWFHRGGDVH